MPGGPISVRMAPERLSSRDAALDAQLLDRQVLDDAVLDVLEAGVVGVEDLAGVDGVERPRRSAPSTARRSASPGRTGSSTPRPTARPCARAGRAPWWPAPRPPPACRPRRSWCGTPRRRSAESSPSSRWIDSICLRRKYSRCCLSAPSRTSSRILRRSCSSVSRSRWRRTASSSRSVTSSVSRTLDLLLERDVGRVADRVGQRAGLADRAQPRADALVDAAQLEDLLDHGAVLALEVARAAVDGDVVGRLGHLDRGGGRRGRCGRRPRRRGRRRRAGRRGRRRAAGRCRSPRRWCRPWRMRCRAAGSRRTRSSSPTSTGSVTSMVGKTTVSSSGTRINEVI